MQTSARACREQEADPADRDGLHEHERDRPRTDPGIRERADGAVDVVPLVDDIASLSLDLWATTTGFRRRTVALAGV